MAERAYDPAAVEKKWQQHWEKQGINDVDLHAAKDPYYVLMMFPYPSAEGLHVGNVYAFTGADVHGRHHRLRGRDVFEPIGFDAFGIHSENFAMKVNRHPKELVPANVANFTRQLKMMGFMFDWRHSVDTTSPDYYKWTQWVFLQLYKAGFAYRDVKEVNFCPECGTVIADEQVLPEGTCERHPETLVQRRKMPCWFFRTTAFADRLERNLHWLDWSEKTKLAQLNWIGRSIGAEIRFAVAGKDEQIPVFTTRPDTLFGATYMVLAPDHPLVDRIAAPEKKEEITRYREEVERRREAERQGPAEDVISKGAREPAAERPPADEKTGVEIGARAVNPATGEEIPIFISDYVLMEYGTGAIMAVPAHDDRDFAFAKRFGLTIRPVFNPDVKAVEELQLTQGPQKDDMTPQRIRQSVLEGDLCWTGPGTAINSANEEVSLNDLPVEEAKERITRWLTGKKLGKAETTFRLRDWGISRQRYWGPPVPIVYDEDGNPHPVPEDQLPITLPDLEDFRPKGDGRGPLASATEWLKTTLPDGQPATRETDVMDNFLDSAWYYLRYVSANDPERPYDPELIRKWLPVDMYIGGNEHAVLHLLYTRFICLALTEAGVLEMGERPEMKDRGEPFRKFRAHGLIVKDGAKMSKSKGNVVIPDEYVDAYGADTLRLYLMFLGPYLQGGDFRDKDIQGARRFVNRLHAWFFEGNQPVVPDEELPRPLRVKTHQTIRKVRNDMDNLAYNTAIAAIMELFNEARAAEATSDFVRESLILCLAPFVPYFAEEVWREALGKPESIWTSGRFPEYREEMTVEDEIEIAIQFNGKVRDRVTVPKDASREDLEQVALGSEKIRKNLGDRDPRKIIVVPGRLVNVIG